jgi:hypothetical protein
MTTTELICIIACSISIIINITLMIRASIIRKRTIDDFNDIKRYMYEIMRHESTLSSLFDDMHEDVESLSTGFNDVRKSFNTALNEKINMRHYPLPDEIKQIEGVMTDQIEQIIGLAGKQRIPNRDMFETIVTNVCNTFPDIEVEYIVRKLTSYIEMTDIVKEE